MYRQRSIIRSIRSIEAACRRVRIQTRHALRHSSLHPVVISWINFRGNVPRRIGGDGPLPMGRIPAMGLCRRNSFLEENVDLLQAAAISQARRPAGYRDSPQSFALWQEKVCPDGGQGGYRGKDEADFHPQVGVGGIQQVGETKCHHESNSVSWRISQFFGDGLLTA
jgi:hypothetical protein